MDYLYNQIKHKYPRDKKYFDTIENKDDFTFINASDDEIVAYLKEICLRVEEKNMSIDNLVIKNTDVNPKLVEVDYQSSVIEGPKDYDYKPMELLKEPVTSITVVGKDLLHKSGIIADLTNMLYDNGIHLYKLNPHHNSITTFINRGVIKLVFGIHKIYDAL